MLSRADNERLTRVGPGTPMGNLLRCYWLPALLEEEVAQPDGAPVRLRLLGEDLVAFRDSRGRIGILDAYCPHRRAHLYYGRNEDCGLRCVYHGWKFDVEGNCVDMPSEPPGSRLIGKVHAKAYPALVRGGVVWVYMGSSEMPPPLPQFEWSRLGPARRTATKRLQNCNWAQAVEGGIDSSHVSFLHSQTERQVREAGGTNLPNMHLFGDRSPVFELEEMPYGLEIAARREAGPDHHYWRVTQFLMPFYSMIPPTGAFEDSALEPYDGHAWVPIDDEDTWTWSFSASPQRDYDPDEAAHRGGPDGFWGPIDENYRPLYNRSNEYGLDRDRQRRDNYTGIVGVPNQDAAVQESMGPISDRSGEHLGWSDRGIVAFRRLLLNAARDLEEGAMPPGVEDGGIYNVRSAAFRIPRDADRREATDRLAAGGPL